MPNALYNVSEHDSPRRINARPLNLSSPGGIQSETANEVAAAATYRIERVTWFGLVGVLVVTDALPDWLALHHGVAPLAAGLVFIVSAVLLHRRGGRIPLSTWLAGTLLLALAGFAIVSRPDLDLSIVILFVAVVTIAMGIFSRGRQATTDADSEME